VPAPGEAPAIQLSREIGRWLSRERRKGGAKALAGLAMAACTGGKTTRGVARREQRRGAAGRLARFLEWHGSIMGSDEEPHGTAEMPGDPAHLRMLPSAVGKCLELSDDIARIKPRQAGRSGAVALALQS